MFRLTVFFISFLLISCGNHKAQEEVVITEKKDRSLIQKKDLTEMNYKDFVLDRKSRPKISGWLKYDELEEKINELKNADLSYFKSDKKVVESLVEELASSLPESINTESIKARVLVVQNMYYKLNSTINLSTSTKEELKKDITDLLEAFSNLNFQINKKFEKDSQDIDKP